MADSAAFTIANNWHGGFYELALELGPTSDARLERALLALRDAVDLPGWYAHTDREPHEQTAVGCTFESLQQHGHLNGIVTVPDGRQVVCGVVAVKEEGRAGIGRQVYAAVDFALGLIGDEVSGHVYAADLVDGVPERRGLSYLVPTGGELRYWPAIRTRTII